MSLVGSQILIAFIALFNSVVIARALGVEDRGYFVMSMILPSILVTFSDFGIGAAGTKFIASNKALGPTVFITNSLVNCVRILLIGALGILVIYFYSDIFFTNIPKTYLYLGLAQVFATAIQGWTLPIFLGLGKGIKYALILLCSSMFSFFLFTTAWMTVGLNALLAVILQVCSSLVASIYIFFSVRSYLGEAGVFSKQYIIKALKFGSGIYVSIISNFANDRMIVLILNSFGGVVYVSLYTLAQGLSERIYLVSDAVASILMPKVAENPEYHSKILTIFVFKITLIITFIISLVLIALAEWIISFIYTNEFYGSIEIMQTLLVAVIFSSGWTVLLQDLNAREFTRETGVISIILTTISLSLAMVFMPIMGVVGAALASIIGYICAISLAVILFISKTDGVTVSMMFFFSASEKRMLKKALQRSLSLLKLKM